jgi:hypothetical protein
VNFALVVHEVYHYGLDLAYLGGGDFDYGRLLWQRLRAC